MKTITISGLILAGFLLSIGSIEAQIIKGSGTPLGPNSDPTYSWLGVYVGPSFNSQGGTFVTDCDCPFTGGAGSGLVAGVMFEHQFRSGLALGALVGYEGRGITGRFRQIDTLTVTSSTGVERRINAMFRHEATLSFDMVTLNPYVKYRIAGRLFGRAGLSMGYVFNSDLVHSVTLDENATRTLNDGETADIRLGENGVTVFDNGSYKSLSSFQVGATLAAGYEIPLVRRARQAWGTYASAVLMPVIQVYQPITQLSVDGGELRVSMFQVMLEFRYNL